MESFIVRYRNLLVLLALLVVQIIGLASQVRRTDAGRMTLDKADGSGVRLIRLWANALVSPPERALESSKSGVGGFFRNYIDLRNVRQENKDLQATIDRLRLEQAAILEDARQGQRLQAMLNFQQKYIYKTLVAQVIGSSGSDQSHVFYIDKGKDYGLARDMAVITADGIVGKIREVFPRSAQVLAINDQSSGAGVILETTRIRGILRGNADGKPQIVGILADQRIKPGEKVLTAGGDEIFPRGLPVGEVEKVERDPDRDAFIDVIIKPAAPLDRLDEVMIITSTEPRFSDQQNKDLATSEELKGAEAAELAEKKKASEIMAERLPGLIDPNLPPDQQPLHDTSNPNPVAHPPMPIHPDRFTPGGAENPATLAVPGESSAARPAAGIGPGTGVSQTKPRVGAGGAPSAPVTDGAGPPKRAPSRPEPKPESRTGPESKTGQDNKTGAETPKAAQPAPKPDGDAPPQRNR
jgi:rod shape-determining protein MreC